MKSVQPTLWQFGFRPFFIGAGVFAVAYMLLWIAIYHNQFPMTWSGMSLYHGHAHEMFYGYATAVITGFLLTGVSNWTGLPTIRNTPLIVLFILWCAARVLFNTGVKR